MPRPPTRYTILIVLADTYAEAERYIVASGRQFIDWRQFQTVIDAYHWIARCVERGVEIDATYVYVNQQRSAA